MTDLIIALTVIVLLCTTGIVSLAWIRADKISSGRLESFNNVRVALAQTRIARSQDQALISQLLTRNQLNMRQGIMLQQIVLDWERLKDPASEVIRHAQAILTNCQLGLDEDGEEGQLTRLLDSHTVTFPRVGGDSTYTHPSSSAPPLVG